MNCMHYTAVFSYCVLLCALLCHVPEINLMMMMMMIVSDTLSLIMLSACDKSPHLECSRHL